MPDAKGIAELLEAWSIGPLTEAKTPPRGSNNEVWLIKAADDFVLRIYRNSPPDRIAAEHHLLTELTRAGLSFAVPEPLPAEDGSTIVSTADGPAALYRQLPGDHPPRNLEGLALAGQALGELDTTLAALPKDLAPIDWRRPLNAIHPALTDVDELAVDLQRELGSAAADWFAHQLADNEATMRNLYDVLPSQLVHGDFGLSNCLVENGRVTGVLDFEIADVADRLEAAYQISSYSG